MLDDLFKDISIGNLTIPNRVVMPPMTTRFASDEGYVTDQTRNYYRERARGGPGLIIFESTYPCEKHPQRHVLVDDSYIEGLRSVVETVHAEGTNIALQMNPHRASSDKVEPLAPSPLETPSGDAVPEISTDRIETLVTEFAEGAARAKRAGFDGLEIHSASGYLIHQFYSPKTNQRTDKYGGSVENRTRFAREILAAVRDQVGPDFPVWFRIPGHEFLEGGLDAPEARRVAKQLEAADSDALHVTAGHNWNSKHIVISGRDKRGTYADLAANIRRAVDVPVMVVGRINDPEVANDIIADGKADLTAMGRAHIADPHIVRKAKAGNLDGIRRCVGGLEGCRDAVSGSTPVSCTVNPLVGREDDTVSAPDETRDLAIIGGGPAGMETARWAARRGHTVTIYEAAAEVGGQLRWAKNAPGKTEYGPLIRFMETELARHDVTVETNTRIKPADLDSLDVDDIIVATGSEPDIPTVEGVTDAVAAGTVVTPEAVLNGAVDDAASVVVYGGSEIGVDTAEYLAGRDAQVTIVSPGMLLPERAADNEGTTARQHIIDGVSRNDRIEILVDAKLQQIDGRDIQVLVDGTERTIDVDTMVLAESRHPVADGFDRDDVTVIGDASVPADLYGAIHEGARLGRTI